MKLAEEAVMDIHAGVEVGMAHVGANGAEEEFASFAWDALACLGREPHAFAAAPRTILRRAMGIDFDTHHANGIGFFFRELVDFAFQLVRLFAIEPPGLATPLGFDYPQPFKHQHTARILLTDLDNGPCRLVCCILMVPSNMCPQLLVAPFTFDRLARLPLFLRYPFEMPVSVLIEAVIGNKARGNDLATLSRRDNCELFHIQIDRDRHQIRIALALHDFLRRDGFGLQKMNGRRLLAQDEFRAFLFPSFFTPTLLKVAIVAGRVVNPYPLLSSRDLEPNKTLPQIQFIEIQAEGPGVEGGMVGRSRDTRFPFLFPRLLPFLERGEIASGFSNTIFDDRTAIPIREIRKSLTEVPVGQGSRMLRGCDGLKLGPGEQLVCGHQRFSHLSSLFGDDKDALHQLLGMGQEKGQIEVACGIQDIDRLFEIPAFVPISSS